MFPAKLDILSDQDHANFESFWQTWMFFGLLKTILGQDIPSTHFIVSTKKVKKIVTTRLQYHAERWRDHKRWLAPDQANDEYKKTTEILDFAEKKLIYLHDHYDGHALNGVVLFSFGVLHEFLCETRDYAFPEHSAPISTTYPGHNSLHFPSHVCVKMVGVPNRCIYSKLFRRHFATSLAKPKDQILGEIIQCAQSYIA